MKLKNWEELEITDDFLFGKVMRNPEICKRTLEAILNVPIEHIEYPDAQKVIDIAAEAKSVRLDVYVKDVNHTVYNIEMQTTNTGEIPKRSRYYQSLIDLELLEKGEKYTHLNRCIVIFICSFDLFKKNRCIYTFENRCIQDKDLALGDETVKIFLNSKGDTSQINNDLKAFFDYMNRKVDTQNDFINALNQAVKKARENKEWRFEYMTLYMKLQEALEDGRNQGIAEGRAEGKAEGETIKLISLIRKKYIKNTSIEDISDMLEETPVFVTDVINLFKTFPNMNDEEIYLKLKNTPKA